MRHQWMDHPDRKPRCSTGLRQKRVSIALCGLLVCHFAVYSDCAPVSLRKEDVLVLRRCSGQVGMPGANAPGVGGGRLKPPRPSGAFFGIFLASSFSRFGGDSRPTHLPLTHTVNCNDICYTLFRLESSKIRLNLAISDGLNM